ncbi:MAG: HD domain-containing protein [Chitinophagaceae bacterium]|nr:HD domain-containing protein [Chitinophagaceae bacterium]
MDAIVKQVSEYVEKLFQDYPNPNLYYHNIDHTRSVVKYAGEISQYCQLSSADKMIVTVAAWFHDVGHLITGMNEHEKKSIAVMKLFLSCSNVEEETLDKIAGCIMSTKLPSCPGNLLEEILCDADTYHLGTGEFLLSDVSVRKEFDPIGNIKDAEWHKQTLQFLLQHKYYTSYCQRRLIDGKNINIQLVHARIKGP